jgi:hypothetical protein
MRERETTKKSVKELAIFIKNLQKPFAIELFVGRFFVCVSLFYLRHGRMNNSKRDKLGKC